MSNFRPQRVNANKHTERGIAALDNSIRKDGWIGAVTVAADGETFDGSARLEALADAMPSAEPIVIETDGTRPVVVKRVDIPDTDDPRAKRLGVAANVIAHMDYAPDGEILALIAADDDEVARLIRQDEASEEAVKAALAGELLGADDKYSKKVTPPIYIPKGDKPPLSDLYDETRTMKLLIEIDASEIPDEEKQFLRIAAQRHTVLNFQRIAEYYSHSDAPVQRLMENSALVIIDFDKAIENGYVILSKEILEIQNNA